MIQAKIQFIVGWVNAGSYQLPLLMDQSQLPTIYRKFPHYMIQAKIQFIVGE